MRYRVGYMTHNGQSAVKTKASCLISRMTTGDASECFAQSRGSTCPPFRPSFLQASPGWHALLVIIDLTQTNQKGFCPAANVAEMCMKHTHSLAFVRS
jgi:hypothetical protein